MQIDLTDQEIQFLTQIINSTPVQVTPQTVNAYTAMINTLLPKFQPVAATPAAEQ